MAPFDAFWSIKKVFKHSKKRQMVPYSPLRSVQKRQKVPGVTALRSLYLSLIHISEPTDVEESRMPSSA